ncbi:MAG: tetratricopeptide repeat protein [Deltaproteobacteria bacterium]|nr:tetratricopeptide repeat protein [Deltaproteobacteria bacterium]
MPRPIRLIIALAWLLPATALAQSPAAAPVAATPPTRGPTPFDQSLRRGAEAFARRDFDAAMTAFRDAVQRDPRSPVPWLRMAAVSRARNDAATALGNYREALRLAIEASADADRARALAGVAELNEAQGLWREAIGAWGVVAEFADAHASVTSAAVPRARIEAIRRRESLDREYAPVRERIAERLRVNAAGAANAAGATAPAPR